MYMYNVHVYACMHNIYMCMYPHNVHVHVCMQNVLLCVTDVQASCGLEPAMVVLGTRMIYVPIMPGHRKRLPQT